jgi:ribonuclease P protein component
MLSPDQRLRANKDFRCVYARAKSFVHPLAVIYVMRRTTDMGTADTLRPRVGFVVSKKQGRAATRNRIKRRLREAVRQAGVADLGSYDIIFVARKRLFNAPWEDVVGAIDALMARSDIRTTAAVTGPPEKADIP